MIESLKTIANQIVRTRITQLLIRTFAKWQQDNCLDMGAALAYYALLSLIPTVLVLLSIFGFFAGPTSQIYDQILTLAQDWLPPVAYQTVESLLQQLNADSVGFGTIGFGLLLVSASGFFSALDRTFDTIWKINPDQATTPTFSKMARTFVERRVFSFLLVLGSGMLLLISLLVNLAVRIAIQLLEQFSDQIQFLQIDTVTSLYLLQLASSFILLFLILMVLFKVLPPARIAWRDVGPGALITAVLYLILQTLVSRSVIGIGSQFHSYGVIGGVLVLMLWIYFTSQILFWGGEFTYVYAQMFGSRRVTRKRAAPRLKETQGKRN
ncbi:MAG: YihY/virulence factor BrkB family protein [Elainellaceae cyanobacterium]